MQGRKVEAGSVEARRSKRHVPLVFGRRRVKHAALTFVGAGQSQVKQPPTRGLMLKRRPGGI